MAAIHCVNGVLIAVCRRSLYISWCADSLASEQAGWGKKLAYVLAAAATGVADVTRRYTAAFAQALPLRTLCSEAELAGACARVTARLRAALPAPEQARLEARDRAEQTELAREHGAAATEPAGLPGAHCFYARQTPA